jgi:DNA-binding GntR family transcriptional regulator
MTDQTAIAAIADQRSRSLTGIVRDELERMILTGELKSGERLNEQALALKLGVSRGPIREARRSLERDGLVVEVAHKGVFVREMQRDDLLENYDVRALITGLQCALVAASGTKSQKKKLREQVDAMDQAILENDSAAYYQMNLTFHQSLAQFARHKLAEDVYTGLVKQSCLRRQLVLSPPESNSEHRAILDAIDARDAALARKLAEAHVIGGKRRWLAKQHPVK